jgi:hypothetical protein
MGLKSLKPNVERRSVSLGPHSIRESQNRDGSLFISGRIISFRDKRDTRTMPERRKQPFIGEVEEISKSLQRTDWQLINPSARLSIQPRSTVRKR